MHAMGEFLAALCQSGRLGWDGPLAAFWARCITPQPIAPYNPNKPDNTLLKNHKQQVLDQHIMTAVVATAFKDVPEPIYAGKHLLLLGHPATSRLLGGEVGMGPAAMCPAVSSSRQHVPTSLMSATHGRIQLIMHSWHADNMGCCQLYV
jgi:hypothetical protein